MPIYVENTHRFDGVVSMTIILGVAEGILGSKDRTLVDALDSGKASKLWNYWEWRN